MALPEDFNKIYGSTATGGLTPISDVDYSKGWEFVGSNPPTKNDFSYLQHVSDLKSQFLYKVIGGEAGAPPIGIPFFWPLAAMPNTVMDEWSDMVFLKPNGASFSAAEYPKLAKVWTSLVIPDMRGEFPRIWDGGRGVDAGRTLLSAQGDAIRNITGTLNLRPGSNDNLITSATGAMKLGSRPQSFFVTNLSSATKNAEGIDFDASGAPGVVVASENRPRNIAFNFLVRAK